MRQQAEIHCGDVLAVLATLPAGSVHCCVTSPPYWGLRDYGEAGQIGLEATPEEYVAKLVEVFGAVRRVLRDDGTIWLNLGDSYANNGKSGEQGKSGQRASRTYTASEAGAAPIPPGLKPGDLVGIPWRVAFALQADGWWLRRDVIWSKPNPMPESVAGWRWERCRVRVAAQPQRYPAYLGGQSGGDIENQARAEYAPCPGCPKCSPNDGLVLRRGSWRCTTAHEYIFQLAKSPDYFCNAEAVREPVSGTAHARGKGTHPKSQKAGLGIKQNESFSADLVSHRNPRSVWTITTKPYSEAHFATFPPELPERCIRAGTAENNCGECGAPWAPVVEKGVTGHRPTCTCNADPVPATVLDIFSGAGTTGLVALRLNRNYIGIELKPEYAELSRKRIEGDAPLFNRARS